MDDARIFALLEDRNPEAAAALHETYAPWCRGIALRILGDQKEAESCVSDTWLRAWASMPPHRPTVLRFFLAKITRNLSLNRYAANRAEKRGGGTIPEVLDELAESVPDPKGSAEAKVIEAEASQALKDAINRFLAETPERERNIFLRRYFYGESVKDVAERYQMTDNNLMVMMSRTRKKLRNFLEKEGITL